MSDVLRKTMQKFAASVVYRDDPYTAYDKKRAKYYNQRALDEIETKKQHNSISAYLRSRGVDDNPYNMGITPSELAGTEERRSTTRPVRSRKPSKPVDLPFNPADNDDHHKRRSAQANRLPSLREIQRGEEEAMREQQTGEEERLKEVEKNLEEDSKRQLEASQKEAARKQRRAELRALQRRQAKEPKATTWGQILGLSPREAIKGYTEGSFDLRDAAGKPIIKAPSTPQFIKDIVATAKQLPDVTVGEYLDQHGQNFKSIGNGIAAGAKAVGSGVAAGAEAAGKGVAAGIRAIRDAFKPRPKTFWEKMEEYASQAYSRSRKFLSENPEFMWGAGGFLGGASLGAALAPKNRLLGILGGGVLGTGLMLGGKYLYDRYNA